MRKKKSNVEMTFSIDACEKNARISNIVMHR